MTVTQDLLTAEQFRVLPDDGKPKELVKGKVVEMSVPAPRHGYYCGNIAGILRAHVKARRLGRIMTNDSGVVTERGPDTVRGADVLFYSFSRLPEGPLPDGYLGVAPELVFEVRSPRDRWSRIMGKVGEYLAAGVTVVCVLDPEKEALSVHRDDEFPQVLTSEEEFALPDILPDLRVPVREFLE